MLWEAENPRGGLKRHPTRAEATQHLLWEAENPRGGLKLLRDAPTLGWRVLWDPKNPPGGLKRFDQAEFILYLHAAVGVEDDRELVAYLELPHRYSLLNAQIIRHRLADRILRRREPAKIDRRRAQRLVAKPPLNFTRLHAALFQLLGERVADLVNG